MATRKQSWLRKRLNNVLSGTEAVAYAVIVFALGAVLGGIATHYLGW